MKILLESSGLQICVSGKARFFCVPVPDCFGVQIYQEISGQICFVQERVIFHIPDMFFFQNSNLNRYAFFSYFFAFYSRYVFSSIVFCDGFCFQERARERVGFFCIYDMFYLQERVDLTFMICFFSSLLFFKHRHAFFQFKTICTIGIY
jgi:hypothetical protein